MHNVRKKVLIVGCGDIGTALGLQLQAQGWSIFAMRRRVELLPSSFVKIQANITHPDAFDAIPRPLDAVVFCPAAETRSESCYKATYVEALENLLHALSRYPNSNPTVLFTSSTAVYGQNEGQEVDETSHTEPKTFSGKTMLEAEALLAAAEFRTCSIRLSGIYGPGRLRLLNKVYKQQLDPNDGCKWTNRIHRDDAAGFVAHLLLQKEIAPLYVGTDNTPTLYGQVTSWIGKALGLDTVLSFHDAPQKNKRCRNKKMLSTGYSLRFPSFKEGYTPLIKDYLTQQKKNES